MKKYSYSRARALIDVEKNLIRAEMGMYEDWFWTAETVWEDGNYTKELRTSPEIGGISGSGWATPAIKLTYADGTKRMLPCYTGESSMGKPVWFELGVLSSPVQDEQIPLETNSSPANESKNSGR